jgi:hypothetical protein
MEGSGTITQEADAEGTSAIGSAYGEGSWDNSDVFDGTIDEVRIYDRALSNQTIRNLYQVSDFTPASRFNEGSFYDVNDSSRKGEFDSEYLQYKLNSLSGDFGPPTVEKASVAQASGWTGFSSSAYGRNLSLPPERYGQVQFNLSSSVAENSPAVEEASLHTRRKDESWLCTAPYTGNWVIDRNCTISDTQEAPQNVEVPTPHTTNVTSTGVLGIDLQDYSLVVKAGARALVDAQGSIQAVS